MEIYRKNSQVPESVRQSERGRIGSAGGNVFLENVRQDRDGPHIDGKWIRTRTDWSRLRGIGLKVDLSTLYTCVRVSWCARMPHYSFEQWTRVGTTSRCAKRNGERGCVQGRHVSVCRPWWPR